MDITVITSTCLTMYHCLGKINTFMNSSLWYECCHHIVGVVLIVTALKNIFILICYILSTNCSKIANLLLNNPKTLPVINVSVPTLEVFKD